MVSAIGQGADFSTNQALGVVVQFLGVKPKVLSAIAHDQAPQATLTVTAGGELCADVPKYLGRLARIFFDQTKDGLIRFPRLIQLQSGYAQALLVHLCGVYRHPAWRDTPHISLMSQRRNIAFNDFVNEDRLDDVEIRQVHATRTIRVVEYEDVALDHVPAILTNEATHSLGEGAQMHRGREPLCNDATGTVAHGCGIVH